MSSVICVHTRVMVLSSNTLNFVFHDIFIPGSVP